MTKGQRLATIIVSILLVMAFGGGAAFALTTFFGKDNGGKLSDKEVIKAITATVDTLQDINQGQARLQTVRTATTMEEISETDAKALVTIIPLAYISYVDYLSDAKVLKIETLQYDDISYEDDSYATYLYTLVTQKDGLVYVNVLCDPESEEATYTSYEIEYDFKKDTLIGFNFIQFTEESEHNGETTANYVCYRYNIKEGKVFLFNPEIVDITTEQYYQDITSGKVDGEYISDNVAYIRCFEGSIKDLANHEGYDVDCENSTGARIDFSSLTTAQQEFILKCVNGIKDYIIPCKQTVDCFDISKAELCDKISDANDYINETYLPRDGQ